MIIKLFTSSEIKSFCLEIVVNNTNHQERGRKETLAYNYQTSNYPISFSPTDEFILQ
jgi:hypothetical protein